MRKREWLLTPEATLALHEGALAPPAELVTDLCQTLEAIPKLQFHCYGKHCIMPRHQLLYGPADLTYTFSGCTLRATPEMHPLVSLCLDYANSLGEETFNGALVNYYPDPCHHVSHHSDDEPALGKGLPILGFSFGCARTFQIKSKLDKRVALNVDLPHGSVAIMQGAQFQQLFTHALPPKKGKAFQQAWSHCPWRLSITVRHFRCG